MTRKHFLTALSALPFCGAIAARLGASEPMLKGNLQPKPEPDCVPVDFALLLEAIAEVEGGSDSKPSVRGERSKYQITAAVWRQHEPRLPFTMCKGGKAWQVALNHLHWLDRHLPRVTLVECYERERVLAYAWNVGLEGYLKRWAGSREDGAARSYCRRVQNLYQSRLNSKHA